MNVLDIIQYEKPHAIKLKHPVTGEEFGPVFNVVSMESDKVAKALREVQRVHMEAEIAGNKVDAETAIDERQMAMMIAIVDSWDWAGCEVGELGVNPECTYSNKKALFSHENSKWIKGQIGDGCAKIANFTQEKSKPAKSTSRSK